MKRKRSGLQPKFILLILTVISGLFIIFSFTTNGSIATPFKTVAGYTIVPMQKGVVLSGEWIREQFDFIKNIKKLKEENQQLQERVYELEYENKILQLDKFELERLRNLYILDHKYPDYPKVSARVIGKGVGNKGAVWVAIRIPDDCIAAHANQSRIQQIPFDDKENCIYSPDVVSFAREMGYFKGKDKDFSFQKAYNPYDFGGLRGCEARVWSFFRKYDSSMDQYTEFIKGDSTKTPMPLYIKPNRLLSLQDVQAGMRDHYEGTDLDMTKDPGAGPYKVPYRWRPSRYEVDGQLYTNARAIATQQTGFVIVPQLRNWLPDPIGGILWFGVDDADMAVFTPLYCSIQASPECYRVGNGDMMNFSWTSAFCFFFWVANMAYHKYSYMIQDIRKVQQELENGYQATIPLIDKAAQELYAKDPKEAVKFLTWFSTTTADQATTRWKKLGEYLLVKYMDGNMKKEENGKFMQNGYGLSEYPEFPGYDEEFYRNIVKSAGERLKAY